MEKRGEIKAYNVGVSCTGRFRVMVKAFVLSDPYSIDETPEPKERRWSAPPYSSLLRLSVAEI